MEKEARGKRPSSLLAGIAAAVTLVLEVYFTYLRNDAGTAPNAWGYLLIAGYLCLAVGCFARNRIVLGIGFGCIAMIVFLFYRSLILAVLSGALIRRLQPLNEKHMIKKQQM